MKLDLKKAREIAGRIRIDRSIHDSATDDPPTQSGTAIILLDDRITELEAANKKLVEEPITAYDSDKEDKG